MSQCNILPVDLGMDSQSAYSRGARSLHELVKTTGELEGKAGYSLSLLITSSHETPSHGS